MFYQEAALVCDFNRVLTGTGQPPSQGAWQRRHSPGRDTCNSGFLYVQEAENAPVGPPVPWCGSNDL